MLRHPGHSIKTVMVLCLVKVLVHLFLKSLAQLLHLVELEL